MNALWNPMAGISQEAYLSILFGIVLVVDVILCAVKGRCPRALRIVGAVFGFLLACVVVGCAIARYSFYAAYVM